MRGLIATTALAATALLLAGCDRTKEPAADNMAAPAGEDPQNFSGPIAVDDNMVGVRAPDNTSRDPAVNEAAGNDAATNESGTPDR